MQVGREHKKIEKIDFDYWTAHILLIIFQKGQHDLLTIFSQKFNALRSHCPRISFTE